MNFWDRVYFDNDLRSYLVVFIVIALSLIVKRFLSRYIASLLYLPVKRSSSNIDKKVFINLVVAPLEIFLVILISVIALDRLTFPSDLMIKVYHVTSKQIVESFLIGILIISFTSLLLRFIDFIALIIEHKQLSLSQSENQLILFFKDFLKVIIVIASILLVMKFCFDAHIGQLITGLSLVGAALALAAKESLENLIASVIIFFDKPFLVGDLVKINEFQGNVEKIGLRSTRLRSENATLVVVPNKQMVDSIIDNYSRRRLVRNEVKLELAPQTTADVLVFAVDEVKAILEKRNDLVQESNVFLEEISKNGALIRVEYFTAYELSLKQVSDLKQEINLEIKRMQEKSGIHASVANSFTFIKGDRDEKITNSPSTPAETI